MRCKCCDSIFHPKIIYKKDDEGNATDEFERFEELCHGCFSIIFKQEKYEEMFSDQWVKPVQAHFYIE